MSTLAESLLKCKVEGNTLYLPPMSDGPLTNYAEVRQALLNAGAKYKRNTFVFPNDAQPYIDRLTGGESVNIKKEFQFFETPDHLADKLVELADIHETDTVLEPSAGQGAIIKAIQRVFPGKVVNCYELSPINQNVLIKMHNVTLLGDDFLQANNPGRCDRIVANPPFSKNQDIDHIYAMYKLLRAGGRIVTIASKHWQNSKNKKETKFRELLDDMGAKVIEIEAGEFKESGTIVSSVIIVIDK
jgi:hypothetical protein